MIPALSAMDRYFLIVYKSKTVLECAFCFSTWLPNDCALLLLLHLVILGVVYVYGGLVYIYTVCTYMKIDFSFIFSFTCIYLLVFFFLIFSLNLGTSVIMSWRFRWRRRGIGSTTVDTNLSIRSSECIGIPLKVNYSNPFIVKEGKVPLKQLIPHYIEARRCYCLLLTFYFLIQAVNYAFIINMKIFIGRVLRSLYRVSGYKADCEMLDTG